MAVREDFQTVGSLEQAGILLTMGLVLPREITLEQYNAMGHGFHTVSESLQWAYGDYLTQGEQLFPDEWTQSSELLGLSPASRSQYARVSDRIPLERRVEGLKWSHHRAVVSLEPDEQDLWLKRALESNWSTQQLADHLKEQKEGPVKVREHERRQGITVAAEHVYRRAERNDDLACVPWEDMKALGDALGIIEQDTE